ncbi:uncharacterized protein A1O9_12149 [Exophiala aquamarina CBS 119918]|uniref:Uncharacterized protein n=1 Tax=Exophiala aquamarina CBS 119918 TaxID=1182545 RepID=A0A072NWM4_9EURO|nr:uncharacterized protein A1O9_12149 [Exophiala aquamarina CBS 119918]KEF51812.1 hypothetical protein A1O9_12149 [Exophiala aquamarina CBS 119918]
MDAADALTSAQPFAHLTPRIQHISQSTIRKKWKPLPQSSQDRVRAILLSLKTKRATSGRIPTVGAKGKPRTKKTKSEVRDQDYERAVEEVTHKLLSRLPRMPFPSRASSTSTSSATDDQFSFEATLNRISSLQATLTMHQRSSHLLRNQIKREQRALKHDKAELTRLEDALRSSCALRTKQERGLHPLARLIDQHEDEGDNSDSHASPDNHMTERETNDEINRIAGIPAHSMQRDPTEGPISLDPGPDSHPDLKSLLQQLQNHLHSMENNTASIRPVLAAMTEAQVALDHFAAARFDEQTIRRLHGLDP